MALDERLRTELEHVARPADPAGVYEELIRRKERRRLARTVRTGVLGLTVVAGSMLAFLGLTKVFDGGSPPVAGTEPSNGAIIFSGGEYPDYDIYRVQPDGTGLANITGTPTEDIEPSLSPDGTRVAFCRFEDAEPLGIWVINVDGTGLAQLTDGEDCYPAWSPDGGQIVFERTSASASDLMVMSSDGSNVRRLVAGPGAGGASPAWSPTGEWIAFHGYPGGPDEPNSAIYLVRPDGSDLTTIGDGPGLDLFPAWSPDGRQIAFVTDRFVGDPESYPPVVAVMNADGSNVRQLTFGGDDYSEREPFWSPDGERIGFVRSGGSGGIYTMATDGNDVTLVRSARELSLYCCPRPSWQPIWEATTPSPPIPSESPTPPPSPSGTPSPFEDIGLGFPVCEVTTVRGEFAPGVTGSAYAATKASDVGGCPKAGDGFQVIAVDVTGDGLADTSYGPVDCDPFCSAFAAPDVDGDGIDELLIQNVQFSIRGLKLFDVSEAGDLVPVVIEPPGSPAFGYQGFEGGTEPQFWLGGDAGNADAVRCEPYQGGRAFVSVTSNHPIEGADHIDVTETTFVLDGDRLRVVDVREYDWPIDDDTRPFLETGGCGTSLSP